jgi:hypothetical protein
VAESLSSKCMVLSSNSSTENIHTHKNWCWIKFNNSQNAHEMMLREKVSAWRSSSSGKSTCPASVRPWVQTPLLPLNKKERERESMSILLVKIVERKGSYRGGDITK